MSRRGSDQGGEHGRAGSTRMDDSCLDPDRTGRVRACLARLTRRAVLAAIGFCLCVAVCARRASAVSHNFLAFA
jgi:hypothetical protein